MIPTTKWMAMSAPPASLRFEHQWIQAKPVILAAERPPFGGTWTPHAIREGYHSTSFNRTIAAYVTVFVFFLFFF